MTDRAVREIWVGKDTGRHYYEVSQSDSEKMAADEHQAVVVVDDNQVRCYRCDVRADITFKCIHIHTVRKTLDV